MFKKVVETSTNTHAVLAYFRRIAHGQDPGGPGQHRDQDCWLLGPLLVMAETLAPGLRDVRLPYILEERNGTVLSCLSGAQPDGVPHSAWGLGQLGVRRLSDLCLRCAPCRYIDGPPPPSWVAENANNPERNWA